MTSSGIDPAALAPGALIAHLGTGPPPTLDVATSVRDRVASLLGKDPAAALAIADALTAATDGLDDAHVRAIAARARAEASIYAGHLADANAAYRDASAHAERAGADRLLGEILVGWVGVLGVLGDTRASNRAARRAERLLRSAGDRVYLAKLYMNLGNLAYHQERHADADGLYRRARAEFEKAGIADATTVSLLVNRGVAATNLDRVREARERFREAEEESERLGLSRIRAQALYNRSHLERVLGDYRAALGCLEACSDLFESMDARDMVAAARLQRANTFLDLGMPRDAIEEARAGTTAFDDEGLVVDAMLARVTEARALVRAGHARRAAERLEVPLAYFRHERYWSRLATCRLAAARARLEAGDLTPALELAGLARVRFAKTGDVRAELEAREVVSACRLAQGRADLAARTLAGGRDAVSRLPAGAQASYWLAVGSVARRRHDDREARRALKRAITAAESERLTIPGIAYRAHAFATHARAYRELAALLAERRRVDPAVLLDVVEEVRGRAHRERLHARRTRGGTSAAHDDARVRLGALTRRLESWEYDEPERALGREGERLRRRITRLERRIASAERRRDAGAHDSGPRTVRRRDLDQVRRRLPADTLVLSYTVLPESLLVIGISRNDVWHRTIEESTSTLVDLVGRVRHQLDTMALAADRMGNVAFQRRAADEVLRRLYDTLLRPIEDRLTCGRLVIVPDGPTHHVPFECLHDGRCYADERWTIARSPTVDLVRPRRRRAASRRVTIAGLVDGGPASVPRELRAVAARLEALGPSVLVDPTTDDVLAVAERDGLLHLSTHGVFRDDNPLFSRLSTLDGALFVADLMDRRIACDLVVLSACASGQTFTGDGDDLSGVTHAFLAAGARQLVASHWRVHDRATAALMDAFYDGLSAGSPGADTALVLRRARERVRESWTHPFYWGAFAVHGA